MQRSHQATKLEEQQAKKGELLKLSHNPHKPAAPTVFPGRLPKRHLHNLGFRWEGGPIVIKNSNYDLKFPAFNMGDPYQPAVKIPHNTRERWGEEEKMYAQKTGPDYK